jgi:acetyl-CoA C-acetyltransferase
MNPVMAVNQAAAVLVTDTGTAEALGIPREKWVYLHSGADATDKWNISERICYHESPVVRFTTETALEAACLVASEIDFFDLYSCFPCATIIAALELGFSADNLPPLTITGGLSYFGGAGNNYTMHSIAHAVERLRRHPDQYGMVTGVGYYLTKYSVGIYSGLEPERPWIRRDKNAAQDKIDALVSPVLCENPHGPATVETYTVLHDLAGGEPHPIIIARLDSGERCFASTEEGSELPARMEREEFIGYRGFVTPGEGGPNTFR